MTMYFDHLQQPTETVNNIPYVPYVPSIFIVYVGCGNLPKDRAQQHLEEIKNIIMSDHTTKHERWYFIPTKSENTKVERI